MVGKGAVCVELGFRVAAGFSRAGGLTRSSMGVSGSMHGPSYSVIVAMNDITVIPRWPSCQCRLSALAPSAPFRADPSPWAALTAVSCSHLSPCFQGHYQGEFAEYQVPSTGLGCISRN